MASLSFRPENEVKLEYATRISQTTWSEYEIMIRSLHDKKSSKLNILATLENTYGFRPSLGQLSAQMKKWGLRTYAARQNLSADGIEYNASCRVLGSDLAEESNLASRLLTERHRLQPVAENSADQSSVHPGGLSKACEQNDSQAEKELPFGDKAYGLDDIVLQQGKPIPASAPANPLLTRSFREGLLSVSEPVQPIISHSSTETLKYKPTPAISFNRSSDSGVSSLTSILESFTKTGIQELPQSISNSSMLSTEASASTYKEDHVGPHSLVRAEDSQFVSPRSEWEPESEAENTFRDHLFDIEDLGDDPITVTETDAHLLTMESDASSYRDFVNLASTLEYQENYPIPTKSEAVSAGMMSIDSHRSWDFYAVAGISHSTNSGSRMSLCTPQSWRVLAQSGSSILSIPDTHPMMRDFSCCELILPTIVELLDHYDEFHAQKSQGDASPSS
jgi:hypothetical protein